MKKLTFTLLLLCSYIFVSAQCTPDSVTYPGTGIHPTSLPDAVSNVSYSQTVQFKFPKDTSMNYMGFPITARIDSVKIDSAKLPKSFTYKCNSTNCLYKGGQYGCVLLTGSPVNAQIGTYNMEIYYTAHIFITSLGAPAVMSDSGKIALKIVHNSGIFYQTADNAFALSQNYPNPFSATTQITFNSGGNMNASLKVSNELGQTVFTNNIRAHEGQNIINFERAGLPSGIYFYSIQAGNDVVTRRMVIKD
jgi:hypothetical protein